VTPLSEHACVSVHVARLYDELPESVPPVQVRTMSYDVHELPDGAVEVEKKVPDDPFGITELSITHAPLPTWLHDAYLYALVPLKVPFVQVRCIAYDEHCSFEGTYCAK
jgi:hypothetical protein